LNARKDNPNLIQVWLTHPFFNVGITKLFYVFQVSKPNVNLDSGTLYVEGIDPLANLILLRIIG